MPNSVNEGDGSTDWFDEVPRDAQFMMDSIKS